MNIVISSASYVFSDHIPGGEFQIAHAIVSRLAQRGHRVHVYAPRIRLNTPIPGTVTYEIGGFDFVGTRNYTAYYGNWWRFTRQVRTRVSKLMTQETVDVIHHIRPAYPRMFSMCHSLGVPFVFGPMALTWSSDADRGGTSRWQRNLLSPITDRVIDRVNFSLGTRRWEETMAAASSVPVAVDSVRASVLHTEETDRHPVIPNGVDGKQFHPADEPPRVPTILFAGILEIRKGLGYLLEAMPDIQAKHPQAKLIVAGEGRDEAAYRQQVEELNLGDAVTFMGRVSFDRMPDLFRQASVFCLPSLGEPFGLTALQAMATGLPVVATNAGGIPEFIEDGESGTLVPIRDAGAIASAIVDLFESPDTAGAMGIHNRSLCDSTYDWDRIVDRIETVYEKSIATYQQEAGA